MMISVSSDNGVVTKEKFQDVVGTDEWQVNNRLDGEYEPRSADEVVKEARESVGVPRTYNVLGSNCEHFATDLRYGKAESGQV